jgi:hypothetical protein
MQYIKFTYVDAVTGISITTEPAANGPVFPDIDGLEFTFARESQYPTNVPEFFGTCPDDADTGVEGVLGVYNQTDWETMRADEMLARNPKPVSCTPAQGLIALYSQKQLTEQDILDAIVQVEDPVERYTATIGYQRATTWERSSATMTVMAELLGLTDEDLDELFAYAVGIAV